MLIVGSIVVACISKLVFWNRLQVPTDPTLDTWAVTICTQVIQCLSISSACALYLKPFLESLESGFIRSDDIRRRGSDYKYGSGSAIKNVFSVNSATRSKSDATRMKSFATPLYATDIEGGHTGGKEDAESQHSRTHIIKETRTFAVDTFAEVRDSSPTKSPDAY